MKFFTLSVTSFFLFVIHLEFPVINANFRAAWQNIGLEEKEKGFLMGGDEDSVADLGFEPYQERKEVSIGLIS
jgi:hypothetical protein